MQRLSDFGLEASGEVGNEETNWDQSRGLGSVGSRVCAAK